MGISWFFKEKIRSFRFRVLQQAKGRFLEPIAEDQYLGSQWLDHMFAMKYGDSLKEVQEWTTEDEEWAIIIGEVLDEANREGA